MIMTDVWPVDGVFALLHRARQLGQEQSAEAIAALLALMEHDSPLVRSEAAQELARIGRALRQQRRLLFTIGQPRGDILTAQRLLDQLSARVEQSSERFRESWAESLGQWRHEGAVEALYTLLEDESPHVRAAAAQALGVSHDQDAISALAGAVADGDPHVRLNVAIAAGAIGGNEVLPILETLRQDTLQPVRCAALQALAQIDSPQALAQLHQALTDSAAKTRLLAIELLADVGPVGSVAHLEELYADQEPVRGTTCGQAARRAVARIQEREGTLWSLLARGVAWIGRLIRLARGRIARRG